MSMAGEQRNIETVVNRWALDYYLYRAQELFVKEEQDAFCAIRDVLDSLLARNIEATNEMPIKIQILQFLSRINEGECLDALFDSDPPTSPLESALHLLENINQQYNIPKQDFKNVCTSLREMIVAIFIKNNEFDKAKEVLKNHFPKPMVGKKAIFMGLVSRKCNAHEVIEQMSYQRFRREMAAFCQRLCPFTAPFLHRHAKRVLEERRAEPNDSAGPDEQDEPGPSSSPQMSHVQSAPCKHTIGQKTRLEAAYGAMVVGLEERTFAQLEEEVQREEQAEKCLSLQLSPSPVKDASRDSQQDGLFQRDSGSPMEASPADEPPQTDVAPQTQAGSLSKTASVPRSRRPYTVARLVVEPDSQVSSQCTAASQEPENDVRREEPPQSPAVPNEKGLQNPLTDSEVAIPTPKRSRRSSKIHSRASTSMVQVSSSDSEEGPSGPVTTRKTCVVEVHNQPNRTPGRNSTKSAQLSSDNEEDPQVSLAPCKTPVQKPRKQLASTPPSKNPNATDDISVIESSLDSSSDKSPPRPVPRTSSTPHKLTAQDKAPSCSKWQQLVTNAKESKETWSDEESHFTSRLHNESTISNSGHRKRMWTESETAKLTEGVKKFGEGNWTKIKAYYSFKDRTNVNLKDRWRTLKKLKMV